MKKTLIILFVFFLCQGSCKKELCLCEKENPETNLPWLKYKLNRMLCVEVYSLYFKGKEYVILSDCPGPDEMAVFYDCDGNKTCELGGISGSGDCNMTEGFTYEFYYANRKFVFSQSPQNTNN